MAEESATQLSFPETTPEEESPTKAKEQPSNVEAKKVPALEIPEGTKIYSGPSGGYKQVIGFAPEGSSVKVRSSHSIDRVTSLNIEFESPPEMQGKTGWLERRRKGPGFV